MYSPLRRRRGSPFGKEEKEKARDPFYERHLDGDSSPGSFGEDSEMYQFTVSHAVPNPTPVLSPISPLPPPDHKPNEPPKPEPQKRKLKQKPHIPILQTHLQVD